MSNNRNNDKNKLSNIEFYKLAGKNLENVLNKQSSVKSINNDHSQSSKRIMALVLETLKYQDSLKALINITNIMEIEKKAIKFVKFPGKNPIHLVMVLLHDLLFSKRQSIELGKGVIKDAILRHKTRLRAELVKLRLKAGVISNEGLARKADENSDIIPRYVRVNTNKIEFKEFIRILESEWKLLPYNESQMPIPKNCYKIIPLIPNLFALNSSLSSALTSSSIYKRGIIVLQDLSSCFPPVVLLSEILNRKRKLNDNENEIGTVIDATAAPGNKTTLLSTLLNNKGRIIAFEHMQKRFQTLQSMVESSGCNNVTLNYGDFTKTDPNDYKDVTHILLDPSCTGSGIVNRLDYLTEQDTDTQNEKDERLNSLTTFQIKIIEHALKFPNLKRVVYSTCSVNDEENEHVVLKILQNNHDFKLSDKASVLPSWETRGKLEAFENNKEYAESVIRCNPGTDLTNGFFVACFDKIIQPQLNDNSNNKRNKKKKKKN